MGKVLVADEVWIATALLHLRNPDQGDFAVGEIVRQAEVEKAAGPGPLRPGVQVHAYLHCVANKPPSPGRYRMLTETSKGRRRLFRPGDPCHHLRTGKNVPMGSGRCRFLRQSAPCGMEMSRKSIRGIQFIQSPEKAAL